MIIKYEFQEKLDTHFGYKGLNMKVKRVRLIENGRRYVGKAEVYYDGSIHEISLSAVRRGHDIIWKENTMDFLPILGLELLNKIDLDL